MAALNRIAGADIDKPPGAVIYTQMPNEAGGIEADLTITRLDQHAFYIVTGTGSVLALRLTYVGELGWELHMPVECAGMVYGALMAAGAAHGLINAGYRAIESLRLEKGYRAWGSDIGPDHSPDEAGLGWAMRLDDAPGQGDFIGRAAVVAQRAGGLKNAWPALPSTIPTWCCWGAKPSIATASASAGSPRADMGIGSKNR